mgnify:CR=1 FL=1
MNETLLDISRQFWEAMEHADEWGCEPVLILTATLSILASPANWDKGKSNFTPVGPFNLRILPSTVQKAELFGDTGVVLTDCDYSLLLDGKETTHHFMVTEVYTQDEKRWKLVTFSFTALVY